ncbi:MAG: hypothetical protein HDR81_02965 [Bacteroides sp.]|nr:hypothetical protein [Bacteroides sp.]
MKKILFFLITILLVGCSKNSHIPNFSILEAIPSQELSDILDYEKGHPVNGSSFEEIYPSIRAVVDNMGEIEKAKYAKLTYRELFNTLCAVEDTNKQAKYRKEWQTRYDELLPQAKAKASQIETEILIGFRTYSFKSNNFGFSSFRNYLRQYGYNKFLNSSVIGPLYIDDNSWRYDAIITEYIDKDFMPKEEWVTNKILDETNSKYPLGSQFIREQNEKAYQRFKDLLDNL